MDHFELSKRAGDFWMERLIVRRITDLRWKVRERRTFLFRRKEMHHFQRDMFGPHTDQCSLKKVRFGWYEIAFRDQACLDRQSHPQWAALWTCLSEAV